MNYCMKVQQATLKLQTNGVSGELLLSEIYILYIIYFSESHKFLLALLLHSSNSAFEQLNSMVSIKIKAAMPYEYREMANSLNANID